MEFNTANSGSLPVRKGRLIKTISDSTIRNVYDAVVELVTNSDDSYNKAEQEGILISGNIEISLKKEVGSRCSEIQIVDEASGMDFASLQKAIEFSSETSGFKEGKNVRGFFGRGLKESIISLGRGEILTLHDEVLSRASIYYNEENKDAEYEISIPIQNLTMEQLKEYGFTAQCGTVVKIQVTNDKKSYIQNFPKTREIIENISSLRGINSNSKRKVNLNYIDNSGKALQTSSAQLNFVDPSGKLVFSEDREIMEGIAHFQIYESDIQLTSPKQPNGLAGLLIKTEGAILDNQLFGFETDPNGLFFFGEVICPGISKAIREDDDSIVDFNRGGLDWRHKYNQELERISKEILHKLIEDRRNRLNIEKQTKVDEPISRILDKICRKLADLAKSEIEESEPGKGEVDSFVIKPMFANIKPSEPRSFSIYTPCYLSDDENTKIVNINSSNKKIHIVNSSITLHTYKRDENVLTASFKILGKDLGDIALITANLGNLIATCEVRVKEPGNRGPIKPTLSGGLFQRIIPALDDDPIQRSIYEEGGIIKVYTKFPGVKDLLGENFEKIATPEGKMILAEILIEAFCRSLANKRRGRLINDDVDSFSADMDRLRRKVSPVLYQILSSADVDQLLEQAN